MAIVIVVVVVAIAWPHQIRLVWRIELYYSPSLLHGLVVVVVVISYLQGQSVISGMSECARMQDRTSHLQRKNTIFRD